LRKAEKAKAQRHKGTELHPPLSRDYGGTRRRRVSAE